jgi:hypothetical protein
MGMTMTFCLEEYLKRLITDHHAESDLLLGMGYKMRFWSIAGRSNTINMHGVFGAQQRAESQNEVCCIDMK